MFTAGKGEEGGKGGPKVDEYSVAMQLVGERPLAGIVDYVTQVRLVCFLMFWILAGFWGRV